MRNGRSEKVFTPTPKEINTNPDQKKTPSVVRKSKSYGWAEKVLRHQTHLTVKNCQPLISSLCAHQSRPGERHTSQARRTILEM